jgi:hypothetical protein
MPRYHNGRLIIGNPEWIESIHGFEDLGGATVILLLPLPEKETKREAA